MAEQLTALAAQTYAGEWEVVVVDNRCTDRTLEIVQKLSPLLPRLTIANARRRRGLNHARNVGVESARGDFVVFCDGDDMATPGWLEAMSRAARDADIVAGRLDPSRNDSEVRAWRPQRVASLLRDSGWVGWMPYAPGGNVGMWAVVARKVGWDERFTFGSSDHDFSWRAQLRGYRIGFAHDAVVHQRHRSRIRSSALQAYWYGRSVPRLWRTFRHAGVPRPDNRAALRHWGKLLITTPRLCGGRAERGRWIRAAAFAAGRLVGSVRERVLCL